MIRTAMASFSSENYSNRSISLPTRSHPSTVRVEEELNKLRCWESSSSSSPTKEVYKICSGLHGLGVLYKCVEDLLRLPLTQQCLARHQNEKWVIELLDFSVMFLDVCGDLRDGVLSMKEGIRELQSALRRRKAGEHDIESYVVTYMALRKKLRKETNKSLLFLKQMDCAGANPPLDLDNHVCAVIRVLREATLITSSVFSSLLMFLSAPILKSKPGRWSFVSRLMQKGMLVQNSVQEHINDLEIVDTAVNNLVLQDSQKVCEAEKIRSAQCRLDALDISMESFENGLECLFRHLIHTRVSFLNIISC